jgi:tetratricopeptide (TPR) repeat protein
MLDVNFQIGASMAIFCTLTIIGADGIKSFAMNKICKTLMFLIMIFISIYGIYNSKKLIDAEKSYDFFKTQIHTSLSKRTITPADVLTAYSDVESKRPGSAFHPMDMYNYFSVLGMTQEALPYLELAIKRSPERAGYYYYRALFMAKHGRKLEALQDIRQARQLYPNNKKYHEFEENLKNSLKNQ